MVEEENVDNVFLNWNNVESNNVVFNWGNCILFLVFMMMDRIGMNGIMNEGYFLNLGLYFEF